MQTATYSNWLSRILIYFACVGLAACAAQSSSRASEASMPLAAEQTSKAGSRLSAERLARLDRVFQQYVDDGRIAGGVALVL